jgi:hypothetical protein
VKIARSLFITDYAGENDEVINEIVISGKTESETIRVRINPDQMLLVLRQMTAILWARFKLVPRE